MTASDWLRLLHGPETDEQKRLARLEDKLNRLMDAWGVSREAPPPAPGEEPEHFLRRGMKINAIQAYREQNGGNLAAAKDAVDALEAEMKAKGLIER